MKLDEIYSLDHVTAYRLIQRKPHKHSTTSNKTISSNILSNTLPAKPLKSRKFRTYDVVNQLTTHFTQCWENCKSMSPKLAYYHSCKTKFACEPYLHYCKGFSRRYSTTKLRISAHDLQIETGRYHNIPRNQRICDWCKTSMDVEVVENEPHMLFHCDLYSEQRSKLIANLNKSPQIPNANQPNSTTTKFCLKSITMNLMSILSPNVPNNHEVSTSLNFHSHKDLNIKPNTPAFTSFKEKRSYVINCVCTFILRCIEKRWKFTEDYRKSIAQANSITFNVRRN